MGEEVKGIVLTGYGLNCDYETVYSLRMAGIDAHRIHINELISNKEILRNYHIMVFIGGFSWADHHGAGLLLAAKFKNHMFDELKRFVDKGRLVIGICNGFQTLVNLGLLPAINGKYWRREVALISIDCQTPLYSFVFLGDILPCYLHNPRYSLVGTHLVAQGAVNALILDELREARRG